MPLYPLNALNEKERELVCLLEAKRSSNDSEEKKEMKQHEKNATTKSISISISSCVMYWNRRPANINTLNNHRRKIERERVRYQTVRV